MRFAPHVSYVALVGRYDGIIELTFVAGSTTGWMRENTPAVRKSQLMSTETDPDEVAQKLLEKMITESFIERIVDHEVEADSEKAAMHRLRFSSSNLFSRYYRFKTERIAPCVVEIQLHELRSRVPLTAPTTTKPFIQFYVGGTLVTESSVSGAVVGYGQEWDEHIRLGYTDEESTVEAVVLDHHDSMMGSKEVELGRVALPLDADGGYGTAEGTWFDLKSTAGLTHTGQALQLRLGMFFHHQETETHDLGTPTRILVRVWESENVHSPSTVFQVKAGVIVECRGSKAMSTYSAKTSSGAKWFDEDDNKEENKDVAPKKEKKESEAISPPHWTHDSRTKKDKRGQLIQLSDHALKMQTDSARVMLCERGYGDMSHRKIASAQFNLRDIPVVYLNEKEPDASWHDLYTTSGSHKVRNGRMKFAIWAQPVGKVKRNWFRRTVCSFWFALGFFLVYCLYLELSGSFKALTHIVMYPVNSILCLLFSFPLFVFIPDLLGSFLTFVITNAAVQGFPLGFGAMSVTPWIRGRALHLRIMAEDFTFANPPEFPHKNFLKVDHINLHLRIPFNFFWTAIKSATGVKWSPIPTVCARQTGYNPDVSSSKCPDPGKKLGVLGIEQFEIEGVTINFELHKGVFNINRFSRLLAEGKAFGSAWPTFKPPCQNSAPRPNCLRIRVIKGFGFDPKVKTMDLKVRVTIRHETRSTEVVMRSHTPIWDEEFLIPVDDASAVLHVEVLDEDYTRDSYIGQWLMTMKFFKIKPDYNFHDSINLKDPDFQIAGVFKLMDHNMLNHGKVGLLEMKMSWEYNEEMDAFSERYNPEHTPPVLTALEQLQANSAETNLKLGNPYLVSNMIDTFPLLFDVKRITIRDVHFFLGDLFRGYAGAEEAGATPQAIHVDTIEVESPLRPRRGKDGITLWELAWAFWIKGLTPVVATKARVLASGSAQIMSSGVGGLISLMNGSKMGSSPTKKLKRGSSIPLSSTAHRLFGHMSEVTDFDNHDGIDTSSDFLESSVMEGYLKKASHYHLYPNYYDYLVQLKGGTLFYHRVLPNGEIAHDNHTWRSIPLVTVKDMNLSHGTLTVKTKHATNYFITWEQAPPLTASASTEEEKGISLDDWATALHQEWEKHKLSSPTRMTRTLSGDL